MTQRKAAGVQFRWNRILTVASGVSLAQFAGCSLEDFQNVFTIGAIQAIAGDAFGIFQGVLFDILRV